jgi:hypothetical protein
VVERRAHSGEQVRKFEVLVEPDLDSFELTDEALVVATDPVLVHNELRVCAPELGSPRPTPGLRMLIGEDDQALVTVRADLLIDESLNLLGRELRTVPNAEAFEPGDLLELVLDVSDWNLEWQLVGIRPIEMVPEEFTKPALVDERQEW